MLALGSPVQVNRQIEKEQELEKAQDLKLMAEMRATMQADLMHDMARATTSGNVMGQEDNMKKLIEENDQRKQEEELEAMDRNPLLGLVGKGSPSMGRKNPAEKFANALR